MSVALANLLLLLFIRTGRATPTAAEIAEIVRLGWTDAITEAEDARLGWSDSVTEAADARLGWTDAITEAADARLGWTDAITDAGDARLGWTDVITVSLTTATKRGHHATHVHTPASMRAALAVHRLYIPLAPSGVRRSAGRS